MFSSVCARFPPQLPRLWGRWLNKYSRAVARCQARIFRKIRPPMTEKRKLPAFFRQKGSIRSKNDSATITLLLPAPRSRKKPAHKKTARKRAVCGKSTHEDQTFFPVHARFPPWLPPTGLVVKLMVTIYRICVKYKFRIV